MTIGRAVALDINKLVRKRVEVNETCSSASRRAPATVICNAKMEKIIPARKTSPQKQRAKKTLFQAGNFFVGSTSVCFCTDAVFFKPTLDIFYLTSRLGASYNDLMNFFVGSTSVCFCTDAVFFKPTLDIFYLTSRLGASYNDLMEE
jgi:hypothetical protein